MKKVISIAILIILIIAFGMSTVYSEGEEYSCTVTMAQDKTQIKAGETVNIIVKLTNINAGEGIAAFLGIINYDEETFDISVEKTESWTTPSYIEKEISVSTETHEAVKEDQEAVKISLTAKENAIPGNYNIEMNNVELSTDNDVFEESVTPIIITIITESTEENKENEEESKDTVSEDNGNTEENDNNKNEETEESKENENSNNEGKEENKDNENNNDEETKENENSDNKVTEENKENEKSNDENTEANKENTNQNKQNQTTEEKQETKVQATTIDKSTANTTLPKTGIQDILLIAIIGAIILAVGFYVGYGRTY